MWARRDSAYSGAGVWRLLIGACSRVHGGYPGTSRAQADPPPRDRSTKHRDRQLDHVLTMTWFHALDSSEPSCIVCCLWHEIGFNPPTAVELVGTNFVFKLVD
ncbi:hypothetical protein OG21DRAFT_1039312 [Imleria badia]|nr:hypothetical protein OG21DRAFT_1039312 [Imleria badia]